MRTTRTVKRESEATGEASGSRDAGESSRFRSVKKEKNKGVQIDEPPSQEEEEEQGVSDRRVLRSQYLALINKISDSKDDLTSVDSDKFSRIFNEFENLHQKVQKPREQIVDAEAFLDIANTMLSSVKSQSANGVSPAEFVNALVNGFGQAPLGVDSDETASANVSIKWKDLGLAVCSTVFVACGCSTMLGPMDTELKERKRAVYRKRTKPGEGVRPDESSTMDDDIQAKALEEKLKSQFRLLEFEHAVFERMVYKNKNQHRRCSYFQYLLKVRRDLRLLRTTNMEEILRPCFHVLSRTGTKQKLHVLESLKLKKSDILDRLRGALRLLSQMTEPILKAASGISVLLACSFFIGSSMTFLALLARLRVLIQQILLDAVSVFNSVTSTSLKKQSVKIAQDGVEVFREFYPKGEECFTLLDCVWKTDKYVLLEKLQNLESSKPIEETVSEDVTTRDSLVLYQTSISSLGEDLSSLPEADNSGVTVTKSSTPIAETASSKTNNALQPEVSENPEDATTRDCSIQYQTSVSPLGEASSPLPEADSEGVTLRESSTPIAETASSMTNIALQSEVPEKKEDATTMDCVIQYQTSVSPLGEDVSSSA